MIPSVKENGGEMSRVRAAAETYRTTKTDHELAREALYTAIRGALAAGLPIGQVADESGFDREHVRRIRDDK